MSSGVSCPVCGIGIAPNPSGKCQDCATQAVMLWVLSKRPSTRRSRLIGAQNDGSEGDK